MNLKTAAAFYKLGHLTSRDLVKIALENLDSYDNQQSLGILAGESNPEMAEVGLLFEQALAELGISQPTREEAANGVAKYIAEKITLGQISPYQGAREIWKKAYNVVDGLDHLSVFVGAASEIEDLPARYSNKPEIAAKYIAEYEEDIRKSAKDLI